MSKPRKPSHVLLTILMPLAEAERINFRPDTVYIATGITPRDIEGHNFALITDNMRYAMWQKIEQDHKKQ
jgi:hypothetical protein